MRIEELKPSKRAAGRWLAVLEDGSILRVGEGEVVDFALCAGRELTDGEAEALQGAALRSSRREKAIAALAARPMSRKELARKLAEWGAGEEETESLCDRMETLGYLNDAEFARRLARHYSAKGYGERRLRDELYRRGVPRDLWDEALAEADDPAEAIDAFLRKHLPNGPDDRAAVKKAADALLRRGYPWQAVSDGLNRMDVYTED